MITVLAALLSGALFYLSQGVDDLWFLAWLAPVPLLWLAQGRTPAWQLILASAFAWLAGMIYVRQCYPYFPAPVLLVIVVPTLVLFVAAVVFARWVHRRSPPWAALLAFPACWTALEYLVSLASPHGSYGSLAYSQVSAPLLTQGASLLGLYSITFLICLFASSLAMALRARRETLPVIAAGLGVCLLNVLFGVVRLHPAQGATVPVAAVVDESTGTHERSLAAGVQVSEAYARAIRTAAAQGARFVVTAETAIPILQPQWREAVLAPLTAASKDTGAQIIAGVYEKLPAADLAVSIEPDGTMRRYSKRHLIPVLEAEFTPGRASGLMPQGHAMAVCKDMDFPRTLRHDAAPGIQLMGVPAGDFVKDAWLHARIAVMRGVENGFPLVRAAYDGLVTVTDAQGRMIARRTVAPTGVTMVVARVPLGTGPTLYTRIGDVFPWLCAVLTGLLSALAIVRMRAGVAHTRVTDTAGLIRGT